jgi:hypothetical protein
MVLSPGWGVAIKPRVTLWEPGVRGLLAVAGCALVPRVRRLTRGFTATPLRGFASPTIIGPACDQDEILIFLLILFLILIFLFLFLFLIAFDGLSSKKAYHCGGTSPPARVK